MEKGYYFTCTRSNECTKREKETLVVVFFVNLTYEEIYYIRRSVLLHYIIVQYVDYYDNNFMHYACRELLELRAYRSILFFKKGNCVAKKRHFIRISLMSLPNAPFHVSVATLA